MVAVAEPKLIKRIFNAKFRIYQKDSITYDPFLCLLGTGLVTSEGELWKRQRLLLAAVFRLEILEEMGQVAIKAVDRLLFQLKEHVGTDHSINIQEMFRVLTLQVIGEAVLSMPPDQSDKVFPRLYLPIVEEANLRTFYPWRAYLPLPGNFSFHKNVRELNQFVTDKVCTRWEEHRTGVRGPNAKATTESDEAVARGGLRTDILDRILTAVVEERGVEAKPDAKTVTQLRDEIKTFLFAGHETSSMMLTWTLYEVAQRPECVARIRAEADDMFPHGCTDHIDHEQLKPKLAYTEACLKEGIRLHTLVPVVTRMLSEDDQLSDGILLAKGMRVVVPIQAVHLNEEIWPDPERYDPERFLNDAKIGDYHFLAFINGFRKCLGQHFAVLEGKIVLSLLLQRYDITLAPEATGVKHHFKIPSEPIRPLTVRIAPRST
eukprot:CAMPEP_0177646300 /NCGR_PEP_ID=MMETSP0447-20121125/9702_1 /TAXON_ID=0 /ORGANISM="Stygamoeba regulata, Strain BSH-02190019" /LENGTH=432 /DNA_ID=CAMNT_0019148827 /DNA_START=285 /DNA_END=1583 /DNA_ORIENTATION=-